MIFATLALKLAIIRYLVKMPNKTFGFFFLDVEITQDWSKETLFSKEKKKKRFKLKELYVIFK